MQAPDSKEQNKSNDNLNVPEDEGNIRASIKQIYRRGGVVLVEVDRETSEECVDKGCHIFHWEIPRQYSPSI